MTSKEHFVLCILVSKIKNISLEMEVHTLLRDESQEWTEEMKNLNDELSSLSVQFNSIIT